MDPLVTAADLEGFPGAPFADQLLAAAGDQVRVDAGWHIAPIVTETLTVYSDGGRALLLPTLNIGIVTEVRDRDGTVLDGWRISGAGVLWRHVGWPTGAVAVDLEHGYAACPPALLPIIAERAQIAGKDASVRQESLGSRSVAYGRLEGTSSASALARYTIPTSP